ncbi:hypothetical protein GCM10009000_059050 [Halobacterium noricense]|uniref:Uncharacterized protein n=1 Tax=Haladaptatus pallidirubidus TaxID=1008152 RepID=A0AAV3UGQ8_9EURY
MVGVNSSSDISIPESIANELTTLDDESLRDVINYAQSLLAERLPQTSQITEEPGEEIISIWEHDGYTLVTKKHSCVAGCDDCPHGPYLYRVRAEQSFVNGERTLHWSFLGRVEKSDC